MRCTWTGEAKRPNVVRRVIGAIVPKWRRGPDTYTDPDNWSGRVPRSGDEVVFGEPRGLIGITHGLDQSGVTLASFRVGRVPPDAVESPESDPGQFRPDSPPRPSGPHTA